MAKSHQQISEDNKQSLLPYADAACTHIRLLMVQKKFSYADLEKALGERGIVLQESNLRGKISSKLLPASLFFILVEIMTGTTKVSLLIENDKSAT